DVSMRCVLTTPFGSPVEPDVNSTLQIVSGPIFARGAGAPGARSFESIALRPTSAFSNGARSSTNTTAGSMSFTMWLSRAQVVDDSEYAGEIGTTGAPTCIAASITRAWLIELSDRIATGFGAPCS